MAIIPDIVQRRPYVLDDELKIQENIDRIKRMQEQQRRPDDPEKPIEVPLEPDDPKNWRTQRRDIKVAENHLDPRVLKKLESARLPTVPMLAHSKKFVGSMLGKITGPYDAAKRILRGAPVESVTGQDAWTLGSTILLGFGRGAGSVLSSGGVGGGKAPPEILAKMRQLRVLSRQLYNSIEQMELVKPKLPPKALKPHSDLIDHLRATYSQQQELIKGLDESMRSMYGKDWELGVGGGGPVRGERFGSKFLNPTPQQVSDFWRDVDAYKANVRVLAQKEGVSEHTIRARLQSPNWARQQPQLHPEFELKPSEIPTRRPTPDDIKRFWRVMDKYQQQPGWSPKAAKDLGISEESLRRRLNSGKWNRPPEQGGLSAAGLPAGGDRQTVEQFYGP